jgi:hypothetical protein
MSTDTSRHQDQKGRSPVRRKGDHLTADRETVMSADRAVDDRRAVVESTAPTLSARKRLLNSAAAKRVVELLGGLPWVGRTNDVHSRAAPGPTESALLIARELGAEPFNVLIEGRR